MELTELQPGRAVRQVHPGRILLPPTRKKQGKHKSEKVAAKSLACVGFPGPVLRAEAPNLAATCLVFVVWRARLSKGFL